MKPTKFFKTGAALLAIAASATTARAQILYNISFAPTTVIVTGPGMVGDAGDYWNRVDDSNWGQIAPGGSFYLLSSAGADTGAGFDLGQHLNLRSVPGGDAFTEALRGRVPVMTSTGPLSLTYTGLGANSSCDLWFYICNDSGETNRGGLITVNSVSYTLKNIGQQTGFVSNAVGGTAYEGNYLYLGGLFADALGSLSITVNFMPGSSNGEADVAGFQLLVTPIPEPTTWALLVIGAGLALALTRRRRG